MNANENQVVTHDSNDGVSEDAIRTMIVPIRGVQVMLDRDLAELQGQKANISARPEIGYAAVKKQREKAA